jgi:hypothetical protein
MIKNYNDDNNCIENNNYNDKNYHNGCDDDNDNNKNNMAFERVWQRLASEERACAQKRLKAAISV